MKNTLYVSLHKAYKIENTFCKGKIRFLNPKC